MKTSRLLLVLTTVGPIIASYFPNHNIQLNETNTPVKINIDDNFDNNDGGEEDDKDYYDNLPLSKCKITRYGKPACCASKYALNKGKIFRGRVPISWDSCSWDCWDCDQVEFFENDNIPRTAPLDTCYHNKPKSCH